MFGSEGSTIQKRFQEHYGYALEGDQETLFFLSASWDRMYVVCSATCLMPPSPEPKLLSPLNL